MFFSPNEDGLSKIKNILDKMQKDGKTKVIFRDLIENPNNPKEPQIRKIKILQY